MNKKNRPQAKMKYFETSSRVAGGAHDPETCGRIIESAGGSFEMDNVAEVQIEKTDIVG